MGVFDDIAAITDGGANTALKVRTALTSVLLANAAPYSVDAAEDIVWDADFADFTAVDPTGTVVWTEKPGFVSAEFSGQSASDIGALLKPVTFAIGDEWVTRVRVLGDHLDYSFAGLVFTDGVLATSKVVGAFPYMTGTNTNLSHWTGTITNMATGVVLFAGGPAFIADAAYVKVIYSAADTFQVRFSADGVSWSALGGGNISPAGGLTPTHVGVAVSKYGGAGTGTASFGPICKVA